MDSEDGRMGACGAGRSREPGRGSGPGATLAADERGTTSTEYALIAAVVAITAIGGLRAFGAGAGGLFGVVGQISVAIGVAVGD